MAKITVITPDGSSRQIDADRYDDVNAKFAAKFGKPLAISAEDADLVRISKVGTGRALIEGAKSGLTANFSDEIAGLGGALAEKIVGADIDPSLQPSFREAYVRERDAARAVEQDAARAHPGAHLAGSLAGGLLSVAAVPGVAPMQAARGAGLASRAVAAAAPAVLTGAGLGAVQGAGAAQELSDIPLEAVKGAALGAVIGLGGAALGGAARAALTRKVGDALRDSARQADTLRALTFAGDTGGSINAPKILKEIKSVPGGVEEFARVQRATGLAPKATTTQGLLDRAQEVRDQAQQVITGIIDGVDAAGGKVSIQGFSAALRKAASALDDRPEMSDLAAALRSRASQYESKWPDVSMRHAQELKNDLGNQVSWIRAEGSKIPYSEKGAEIATKAITEEMDKAAEAAFAGQALPAAIADQAAILTSKITPGKVSTEGVPDALAAYRAARRVWHVANLGTKAAEGSVGRAGKRAFFSLGDKTLAQAGAGVGGAVAGGPGAVVGAAALPLAAKGLRPYEASLRATAAETAQSIVGWADAHPGTVALMSRGLKATLGTLREAAQRGPQALAVAHQAALEDPEYRSMVTGQ